MSASVIPPASAGTTLDELSETESRLLPTPHLAPDAVTIAQVVEPAPAAILESEPIAPLAINPPELDATCTITPGPFDRSQFSVPLPATARWNPPGQKRVGLQAGHWLVEQSPPELRGLQGGSSGGGKAEWEVNLDIAQRVGAILEAEGIQVDILPSTIPVRYRAHAFVSIHADGDVSGRLRGYKLARPGFSSLPEVDDRLLNAIYSTYGAATGLARDDEHISRRMLYYYAFNSRRYCHAVAPGVPQVIVETGFLTNAGDRGILLGNPEASARGIAAGILNFLRQE
ncbi:MAG: N-acetylmuramoyl-L-alanine amidase [Chloroflexota bacterium]